MQLPLEHESTVQALLSSPMDVREVVAGYLQFRGWATHWPATHVCGAQRVEPGH